jgi:hypothetical protein
MNVHINGIEIPELDLTVEYVRLQGKKFLTVEQMKRGTYRAIIKGKRGAMDQVFKAQPATLVLERAPADPALADAFGPIKDVRVRGHKFRIYRRDRMRNKVHMRRVPRD